MKHYDIDHDARAVVRLLSMPNQAEAPEATVRQYLTLARMHGYNEGLEHAVRTLKGEAPLEELHGDHPCD